MMKLSLIAGSCALSLAIAGCGKIAETPANSATPTDIAATDTMVAGNAMAGDALGANTPQEFVAKAAMSDMYEIESSKLAETQAAAAGVKTFARDMVKTHNETSKELKTAIIKGKIDATPPKMLDADHQAKIDALKAVKGADFDALYKMQQVEGHTKTLALMQGYAASGTDSTLKALAAKTAPIVKGHLDMIKGM